MSTIVSGFGRIFTTTLLGCTHFIFSREMASPRLQNLGSRRAFSQFKSLKILKFYVVKKRRATDLKKKNRSCRRVGRAGRA